MVHHEVCPLCTSENIGVFLECTDHFLSREKFSLFNCTSCGFIFSQDYPGEGETGRYYESDEYISHSDTSSGFSNKIYRLVRDLMLHRKESIVKNTTLKKTGSLLDIGCGTGYFAGKMKSSGWEVKGIEINEKARAFGISNFGLEILDPTLISSISDNSFDCITLWHVLEHFHDPFKYSSEILRLLKPGGICLVALPNCSSADAYYYGKFWAAYDVPRHLWHFTPSTFRIFSEKAGFTLAKKMTLPLDVFYISTVSEKYKGSSFPFIRGIIRAKFFALRALFNKEKSSSVIYILRKTTL